MHKVIMLALREYKAAVKTKGFIIGLVLAPLVMGGSIIVMVLMESNADTTDKHIAVIDHTGQVAQAIVEAAQKRNAELVYSKTGKKIQPAFVIESVAPDHAEPDRQRLELSGRIRTKSLHAFVEIDARVLEPPEKPDKPLVSYHSPNALADDVRYWLRDVLNDHLRRWRMREVGVSPAALDRILAWVPVEGFGLLSQGTEADDIQEAKKSSEVETFIIPIVMVLLLLVMIFMGIMPHLFAVMEEKTLRIYEVMLGSVQPFYFMLGKLLGGVMVSLTAALVYIGLGLATLTYLGVIRFFPLHILPWFLVYLVFANLMYGAFATALGSACNDARDAQNMNFPSVIPVIFSTFFLMPVIQSPNGTLAVILSLIPTSTPMLMMLRQISPAGVPAWQLILGFVDMFLFTLALVWLAGRIFRVGILMQGKAPTLGGIIKWAFKG